MAHMKITEQALKLGLGKEIPREIFCLDSVGSTQEVARKMVLEGSSENNLQIPNPKGQSAVLGSRCPEFICRVPEYSVIFAEEQTAGHGRFKRWWFSPKGKSVLCSFIFHLDISREKLMFFTAIGSLAVTDAIYKTTGLKSQLEFPNDVMLNNKKVAGILAESVFTSRFPNVVLLGIGINVNIPYQVFPQEIRNTATSLLIEKKEEISRISVSRYLINSMDEWYSELRKSNFSKINCEWKRHLNILSKEVNIHQNGKVFSGVVEDINLDEGLILREGRHFCLEYIDSLSLV